MPIFDMGHQRGEEQDPWFDKDIDWSNAIKFEGIWGYAILPPRCTGSAQLRFEQRDICDDTECPRHSRDW